MLHLFFLAIQQSVHLLQHNSRTIALLRSAGLVTLSLCLLVVFIALLMCGLYALLSQIQ